jgi:hypothetical protein
MKSREELSDVEVYAIQEAAKRHFLNKKRRKHKELVGQLVLQLEVTCPPEDDDIQTDRRSTFEAQGVFGTS